MKSLNGKRIGYAGYSRDFTAPGDRRRFSAYARQRGLTYDYPDLTGDYDVVIVTQNADLAGWTERKRRAGNRLRLYLDLVDSYFEQRNPVDRVLKGVGRYVEGRDSRLSPDFRQTLKAICRVADGVWCSTPEQQATIRAFNPNVEISFDWFDDELGPPKQAFQRGERLRLVWEGQGALAISLRTITEALNELRDKVELLVVTDPTTKRWYGRFATIPTLRLLNGITCPITLLPWRKESFSSHITSADLAIIPMATDIPMIRAKPANKLILLWKLGMPVLTSATPAYRDAMAKAGLDMVCASTAEWIERLDELAGLSQQELATVARRGREHATTMYDLKAFQAPFERLIERSFGP
jgi:hypothetical protein